VCVVGRKNRKARLDADFPERYQCVRRGVPLCTRMYSYKIQVKFAVEQAMKAHKGRRSTARRGWVVTLTLRSRYIPIV
jgi:hypothetical protein